MLHSFFNDFNPYYNNASLFFLMILIRIIIMLHSFFNDFNPYYNNASQFF